MLLVGIGALCAGADASAGGVWTLEPGVSGSSEYSTNPTLRSDKPAAGYAAVAQLSLLAAWDQRVWHFEATPEARIAAAGGDSALGADSYHLGARGDWKQERTAAFVTGNAADDSLATREPIVGTPVRINVRRRSEEGSIGASRLLTERWSVAGAMTAQTVNFQKIPGLGLYDYRNTGLSAQLTQQWRPRTQLQLVVSSNRYRAPTLAYGQQSESVQVGIAGAPTERDTFTFLYGWSRGKSLQFQSQPSGVVYLASVSHQNLLTAWTAAVSQTVQPSGFQSLVRARDARVGVERQSTERLRWFANLHYVETTDLFAQLTLAARDYTSVSGGVSWAWTPLVDLRAEGSWSRAAQHATILERALVGDGSSVVVSLVRRFGKIKI